MIEIKQAHPQYCGDFCLDKYIFLHHDTDDLANPTVFPGFGSTGKLLLNCDGRRQIFKAWRHGIKKIVKTSAIKPKLLQFFCQIKNKCLKLTCIDGNRRNIKIFDITQKIVCNFYSLIYFVIL